MMLNKSNRIKKRQAKHGFDWCPYCDRYKLSEGEKCKVCGYRKIKRYKKYAPEE